MMKDEISKQPPDMEIITYYWRKTFTNRRLFIRNNSTTDVLSEYPAYSLPSLVNCMNSFLTSCIIHLMSFQIFEEVRMTMDIDVERNVELFLPVLFEKVPDNSMFISGKIMFKFLK